MCDAATLLNRNLLKLTPEKFRELRDIIYERSGIFFSEQKIYLLEARLSKRIKEMQMSSFDDYIHFVKKQPGNSSEFKAIFNNITINETFFFRYNNQLEVFVSKLIPQLYQQAKTQGRRKIRIWSAGCSSGEEVYTIAMMLRETLNGQLSLWDVELNATDLSHRMLDKARKGTYSNNSFRQSMIERYKTKYFSEQNGSFIISNEIKRMVKFDFLNLNDIHAIHAKQGMDVVLCRNVLIYFDAPMKKKVIRSFYDILNHGGYLFLGETESIHGISSAFKVEHFPGVFMYRKE